MIFILIAALVFLMGMRQMAAIMAALIAHGLAADTPAAAIQQGTTGAQKTVVATAGAVKAPKEAKLTIRLKFKTKIGERQSSNVYIVSLFP